MIVFITSLRHPQQANSYELVLRLLDQTLASVLNQTSSAFAVIVVCNERPNGCVTRHAVKWVEVSFPPPRSAQGPRTGMPALRLDRGTKYAVALAHARSLRPDHVMFFDADDFISHRLAEFANRRPESSGWYIADGFAYDAMMSRVGVLPSFQRVCGTSHILNWRLFDHLPHIPTDAGQDEIVRRLGRDYICRILGSHRWLVDHYGQRGERLVPLPFPGAVYNVGHGENHTAAETLWTRLVQPTEADDALLLNTIRREFNIPVAA